MTCGAEELLQISGLQHFAFCRRQWALIHIERQWRDNLRTVEGELFHQHAHDERARERRGDTLILRGLAVASGRLGVSGKCDVVEFHAHPDGVSLYGEDGLWMPYPVEYKRGEPKPHDADALQLCAQAMCLEEMLCCSIAEGALFYGQTRRRCIVPFTQDLRDRVASMLEEMRTLYAKGHTPRVKPTKACNACSLKQICLPALMRGKSAGAYLRGALEESI